MILKSIIKFARIRIIATCFALVFLGSAAAGGITAKTLLAFILIMAFIIHANSINDYADKDIDAINLKEAHDRPLVTKDISNTQFWIIHFSSGLLALVLSVLYGFWGVALVLAALFIDYIYSLKPLRVTDRSFASPLLLAATYTYFSFSLGWLSTGTDKSYPWLLTIGLSLGFVARLLLKDFRDIKGDKKHGKITFLLRYGAKVTTAASGAFWILAMLLAVVATSFAIGLLIPLALGSILVSIWLHRLSQAPTPHEQQELVAVIAKAANFAIIAILAYLLCYQRVGLSAAEMQVIPLATGTVLLAFTWLESIHYRKIVDVRAD